MMKFFRKHNKKLIAIFMALLMIVFIGGSALQNMLTTSQNRVVATSALGEITTADQAEAARLTRLMLAMGLDWSRPIPFGYTDKQLEEIDWILLVRETEKLGLMLEPANVRAGFQADQLAERARLMKIKVEELVEATRQFKSVRGTALTLATASAPGEATVRAITRDVLETVQVNAVVLPAKMFVDTGLEFSEAALAAQFEAYKDKEKGEGLNFGYYQHPRVKVQFVHINRDELAKVIGIPNLESRAHKLYEQMVARDDKLIERPQEELAAGPDGPAPSALLNWDESADVVTQEVRREQAEQMADRIASWLIQHAASAWIDSERDESGYRSVPEAVTGSDYYRDLVAHLPREVNYPTAISVSESNFFTEQGASDVPNIGYTSYRPSRGIPTPFARLAFLNQGVMPKIPQDAPNRGDYVALYETCPYPMADPIRGHRLIFRVIETQAGRAAESLQEVRDQVVADLRLVAAYEEAQARAESLRSCAVGEGLQEGYDTNLELVALRDTPEGADSGFIQPPAFSRLRKYQASTGRPEKGVFVGGGLGVMPNWAVDKCFALAHATERVTVLPVPDRGDVIVAELVQVNPPVVEDFIETRKELLGELTAQQWRDVLQNWMDPEQIRARNGMELVRR